MTREASPFSLIGRREFVQLCAGSLALAASGCRRGDASSASRPGTVIMAIPRMRDILPDEVELDFLPFSRLADRDEHGEYVPLLAERWDRGADNLEWTYHLRRDVRWHDGQPFTAHDVKFTLDLLSHPDVLTYSFDSVTVVDDHTVSVRVPRWQNNGYQDDIVFYPRHLLAHLDPKQFMSWEFWTRPVGTGPFRFVRFVPETLIEFEANPDYFRGKPRIERLILKVVGNAGVTELLSGQVDITLDGGDSTHISRVVADPRFRAYLNVTSGPWAIFWKHSHPLFRDPGVRRALTLAIDRQECLGILNLPGDLAPIDGVFLRKCTGCLSGPGWSRGELSKPLPFDPGEAGTLLDAAGWRYRQSDGLREHDGHPFRFTALVRNDHDLPRLAVLVQAQLRRVGVEMRIQIMDEGAVGSRMQAGDFEAALGWYQWSTGFQERAFGRGNTNGYSNPEAFRLIDAAVAAQSDDELEEIYRELTAVYRADMPVTALVPRTSVCFAHRRVRGLKTLRAYPDRYMEDFWLEEER